MRKLFVVTDLEMTIWMVVESPFQIPKGGIDMSMWTRSQEHELTAMVQAIRDRMKNEVHSLLMIEAPDKRNQWTELVTEPEAITQRLFIGIFILQRLDGIAFGDVGIESRVPNIVINPVEHTTELLLMDIESALQPHAQMG